MKIDHKGAPTYNGGAYNKNGGKKEKRNHIARSYVGLSRVFQNVGNTCVCVLDFLLLTIEGIEVCEYARQTIVTPGPADTCLYMPILTPHPPHAHSQFFSLIAFFMIKKSI